MRLTLVDIGVPRPMKVMTVVMYIANGCVRGACALITVGGYQGHVHVPLGRVAILELALVELKIYVKLNTTKQQKHT